MARVPESLNFPKNEEEIQRQWQKLDAFRTSVKKSEGKPEYSFYDGPPFATGLPHYGHILAGTIKDVVTRYAHQTGHYVERRFGWDCHGLPVEYEIDKTEGIRSRDDVLKMGIPAYNAKCRAIVMRYSTEWEVIVNRLGRWIDFQNDYKTLDTNFMESVWWVFKQIYEKGLVYRGFKVMPYSTACTTPLSNFEANQAYKDVDDPAVIVSFPLKEDPNVSFIAWTTTPWTLPSNFALCVNPTFEYVQVKDKKLGSVYIMAKSRLISLFKDPSEYEIQKSFTGKQLEGKKYEPLFHYFDKEGEKGWFVVCDNYVTDDSGTGIVHNAPAFGEDDYRVCLANKIIEKGENIVCPVDASGRFTKEVKEWAGVHVKEADKSIIKHLKDQKRLIHQSVFRHSYPFCWRSDTPLIYKAVPSWFVAVEKVKDKLVANNKLSRWVPDWVQEKRFHNWLQDARDWAISRNRFWGTPIPIWASTDGEEIVVIGSIAELEKLSGAKGIKDLHRESIDHITIPSSKGKGTLRRIDEVFDCWFESGSMPYAQVHYPFENKERFEKSFPADFIAEGIDQTRGWFYTLLVISTILFNKPPFKNLIVNGLVLAADGKKMSKRLKNYPDPLHIVHEYGADALRIYLINSPVVRGDNLRFVEGGVKDCLKDVMIPWFNSFRFLSEYVEKYEKHAKTTFKPSVDAALSSKNIMDRWILAALSGLIKFVMDEMAAYRLYTVIPRLVSFIEQLTNWYIKLNRRRLKGGQGVELQENYVALATLFEVIFTISKAMAPLTPFITEYFYQFLKRWLPESDKEDSVHYLSYPKPQEKAQDPQMVEAVRKMQQVIELGRQARERKNKSLKYPLKDVLIIAHTSAYEKDLTPLMSYLVEELNVHQVRFTTETKLVQTIVKPNFVTLGKRLGADMKKVQTALQNFTEADVRKFEKEKSVTIEGHILKEEDLLVTRQYSGDKTRFEAASNDEINVILDLEVDEELVRKGLAREVINRAQRLRKKAGIHPTDHIEVFYSVKPSKTSTTLTDACSGLNEMIESTLGKRFLPISQRPQHFVTVLSEESEVLDDKITIEVARQTVTFNEERLLKACGGDKNLAESVKSYLATRDYDNLLKRVQAADNSLSFNLDGKEFNLKLGSDFFFGSPSRK